ncbi:hypothetical protein AMECASPLE_031668 [Ameca splendens]|uniref:Uncharacterized protein n=1 Tax=Ameca splendens TaxID=208324 RepID=A0ABV0XVE4_9TELE
MSVTIFCFFYKHNVWLSSLHLFFSLYLEIPHDFSLSFSTLGSVSHFNVEPTADIHHRSLCSSLVVMVFCVLFACLYCTTAIMRCTVSGASLESPHIGSCLMWLSLASNALVLTACSGAAMISASVLSFTL